MESIVLLYNFFIEQRTSGLFWHDKYYRVVDWIWFTWLTLTISLITIQLLISINAELINTFTLWILFIEWIKFFALYLNNYNYTVVRVDVFFTLSQSLYSFCPNNNIQFSRLTSLVCTFTNSCYYTVFSSIIRNKIIAKPAIDMRQLSHFAQVEREWSRFGTISANVRASACRT